MNATRTSSIRQAILSYWRQIMVLGLSIPLLTWVALMPPFAQDPAYHNFADQRGMFGIPHFWNVISNVPFAVIGLVACRWLLRAGNTARAFAEPWERNAYVVFFFGELLTSLGSAYYHASPDNQTLLWDRLSISFLLTAFSSIVVTEFMSRRIGRLILIPQVLIGLFSVLFWSQTEMAGRGDLRLYILVQFYPVLAAPLVFLLFRSSYTRSGTLILTWSLYGAAKLCELYDTAIYRYTGFWSGHTLKHLVAAGATYALLYGLQRRCACSEHCSKVEVSQCQGEPTLQERLQENTDSIAPKISCNPIYSRNPQLVLGVHYRLSKVGSCEKSNASEE